jgi:uncharacterized protein (DUF2141 family)
MTIFSTLNVNTSTALEVNITNIKTVKGYVIISIYNDAEKFPKDDGYYKKVKVKVKKTSVKYTFKDLPKGDYAIALLHDANSDNKCNFNFFGIPKEGFGFSKNFKPTISAPSFNRVKFNLKSQHKETISLIHY